MAHGCAKSLKTFPKVLILTGTCVPSTLPLESRDARVPTRDGSGRVPQAVIVPNPIPVLQRRCCILYEPTWLPLREVLILIHRNQRFAGHTLPHISKIVLLGTKQFKYVQLKSVHISVRICVPYV